MNMIGGSWISLYVYPFSMRDLYRKIQFSIFFPSKSGLCGLDARTPEFRSEYAIYRKHTLSRWKLLHCNDNTIYIFLFWELRGLSSNFHIHVSVCDLYIPRIGPHISSSRKGRLVVGIYNSLTDTWMWVLGLRPRYSFSGNICFKFSAFCLCSVWYVS